MRWRFQRATNEGIIDYMRGAATEALVELDTKKVTPVKQVRSTLLSASLDAVTELGKRPDYFLLLPMELHDAIEGMIVGEWLPVSVAIEHYRTIEQLGITDEQAYKNGRRVADRVQRGYAGTVIRALGAGVTPFMVVERTPSFWSRLMEGGGVAAYATGPKDARLEFHGFPLAEFAYIRHAFRGIIESTAELVTRKVYGRVVWPAGDRHTVAYEMSWV
jgi:hypothetical protein